MSNAGAADTASGATRATTEPHDAVGVYRRAHQLADGPFPQVQGILPDDVAAAVTDPRTITGTLDGVTVPVLIPLERADWYSLDYLHEHRPADIDAGTPLWHLSTFPAVDDDTYLRLAGAALVELSRRHPGGALVFVDHADRSDDPSGRRLPALFDASPGAWAEQDVTGHGPAGQHYYAGLAVRHGDRPDHALGDGTSVGGPRDDEQFLDELWAIYEEPFRGLSRDTPLRNYFERDELAHAISRPGVVQAEHRFDGRLVSWLMLTDDMASFPWMDPDAFRGPVDSDTNVFVFPGLVTDQAFRGNHCADRLIDAYAAYVHPLHTEFLVAFETIDENVAFLPDLIADQVNSTGSHRISFDKVGTQLHRVWALTP